MNPTFGIEIEGALTNTDGVRCGGYHSTNVQYHGDGETAFCVGSDGSLSGLSGTPVEITPPSGLALSELWPWCEGIADFFRVHGGNHNESCGVHVHVGMRGLLVAAGLTPDRMHFRDTAKFLNGMMAAAANCETALFAAAGSTRRMVNDFCGKLKNDRGTYDGPARRNWDAIRTATTPPGLGRYFAINFARAFNGGGRCYPEGGDATVEVRLFPSDMTAMTLYSWAMFAGAVLAYAAEKASAHVDRWPEAEPPLKLHPGRGPFVTSLERMFYMVGWTKGKRHTAPAFLPCPEDPTLDQIKDTLRKRATWLDQLCKPAPFGNTARRTRCQRVWAYLADGSADVHEDRRDGADAGTGWVRLHDHVLTVEGGVWVVRTNGGVVTPGAVARAQAVAAFLGAWGRYEAPTPAPFTLTAF